MSSPTRSETAAPTNAAFAPPLRPAKSALQEVLYVYLAVCAGTFVLTQLRGIAPIADYVHLGVGALFLISAMKLAGREERGFARYGIGLGGLLAPPGEASDGGAPGPLGIFELGRVVRRGWVDGAREILIALALAAIVFPPFAIGFVEYHGSLHPFAWNPPPDFGSFIAAQFVVVGLTEEAFFRGYVQTRLGERWAPTRTILGARVHPLALVVQAALFAAVHVIATPNPAQLATFFPGLVFGWLRGWRGGIGAALVFHALCNVFSELLVRGWLR